MKITVSWNDAASSYEVQGTEAKKVIDQVRVLRQGLAVEKTVEVPGSFRAIVLAAGNVRAGSAPGACGLRVVEVSQGRATLTYDGFTVPDTNEASLVVAKISACFSPRHKVTASFAGFNDVGINVEVYDKDWMPVPATVIREVSFLVEITQYVPAAVR